MKYDVALFDADGVLTLPEEFFSVGYARARGFSEDHFDLFFLGEFKQASVGNADLKTLIRKHQELWKTDDVDALLDAWFEAENVRNEPLLSFISRLKLPVFVASVQERYRAQYFADVMFRGEFDGFYFSHSLGVAKPDRRFFELILEDLETKRLVSDPSRIFFIDDRQENVDGARAVGIDGYLYESVAETVRLLS